MLWFLCLEKKIVLTGLAYISSSTEIVRAGIALHQKLMARFGISHPILSEFNPEASSSQ